MNATRHGQTVTKAELTDMLEDAVDLLNDIQMNPEDHNINGNTLGRILKLLNSIPQEMAESFLSR